MLKTLLFFIVAIFFAALIHLALTHNGEVLINWLGYEIKTDVITAIIIILIIATILSFLLKGVKFISKIFINLITKIKNLILKFKPKKDEQSTTNN